jgi:hypothetical protein
MLLKIDVVRSFTAEARICTFIALRKVGLLGVDGELSTFPTSSGMFDNNDSACTEVMQMTHIFTCRTLEKHVHECVSDRRHIQD